MKGEIVVLKIADRELKKIGFSKVDEDSLYVKYERKTQFGYIHSLSLMHKASGRHLVMSYQDGGNSDGFDNAVGMTMRTARLCLRKMREKGWKERDDRH
jgi:hypothetical protein